MRLLVTLLGGQLMETTTAIASFELGKRSFVASSSKDPEFLESSLTMYATFKKGNPSPIIK